MGTSANALSTPCDVVPLVKGCMYRVIEPESPGVAAPRDVHDRLQKSTPLGVGFECSTPPVLTENSIQAFSKTFAPREEQDAAALQAIRQTDSVGRR